MKKYVLLLLAALLTLTVGCGRAEEKAESAVSAESEASVGDAGVEKIPQAEGAAETEGEVQETAVQGVEPGNMQPEDAQKPEGEVQQTGEVTSGGEIVVDAEELVEPETELPEDAEDIPEPKEEDRMQIVFLGDSILDGSRDETGIAYLTGLYCDADVYNLAIGGTTAALKPDESAVYDSWSSWSLQGLVHVICGNVDPSILDGKHAREVYDSCDFGKTDYFVLEYGMNDFLSGIPINDDEDYYDEQTYVGALRIAVSNLKKYFPDAEIILCSPTYAQFWGKDGAYLGDGNMVNNGQGTLAAYYRVCGNVSSDNDTLFLNAYEGIGLNTYTADEWLEDGIHLTEKGRRKYAEKLSELILDNEQESLTQN